MELVILHIFCLMVLCMLMQFLFLLQRDEAAKVYEHFVGLGVKPNAMTFSLLVDAQLIKRDLKGAISVVDEMVLHSLTAITLPPHPAVPSNKWFELTNNLKFGIMCRCVHNINHLRKR